MTDPDIKKVIEHLESIAKSLVEAQAGLTTRLDEMQKDQADLARTLAAVHKDVLHLRIYER